MICQDCKKRGSCKKAEKVCEDFGKMHRTITKLDKADNGVFEFSKLEVEDDVLYKRKKSKSRRI